MGARTPPVSSQVTSPPQTLPAGNPSSYSGGMDHSFTLQAIMELQKNCGALTAQISSLSGQIDRMEKSGTDSANKFDDKIDDLTTSVRGVESKLTIVSKVGGILFLLGVAAAGVIWTVTQDAFKDIAKTAINSTIVNTSKPTDIPISPSQPEIAKAAK